MELYRFPPQFVSQVWSHYRVIMIADINALDTTDYDGKKLRIPSGVTVLDIGTLRTQYTFSPGSPGTINGTYRKRQERNCRKMD